MTSTIETPKSRNSIKNRFKRPTKGYWNPYWGGILLGLVLFISFFITGQGLGASGGLNRMLVWVEDLVAPDHVDRTPYLIDMAGGELNPLDSWIVMLSVGTILGGFISGWLNGRVKVETNKGPKIFSNRSLPQNIKSAIRTTPSTTQPVSTPNNWGKVKRPKYESCHHTVNLSTVSPKAKMPKNAPSTKKMPSILRVASAVRDVPGQKPPIIKPIPMISPPTIPGHK